MANEIRSDPLGINSLLTVHCATQQNLIMGVNSILQSQGLCRVQQGVGPLGAILEFYLPQFIKKTQKLGIKILGIKQEFYGTD